MFHEFSTDPSSPPVVLKILAIFHAGEHIKHHLTSLLDLHPDILIQIARHLLQYKGTYTYAQFL
jgi:hypothetical protein